MWPPKRTVAAIRSATAPARSEVTTRRARRSDMVAGKVPATRRDQDGGGLRPPRPGFVELEVGRMLQHRLRRLPQPLDAAGAVEQRLVADHHVVDQALVGLESLLAAAERVGVAELHLGLTELDRRTGHLREEVQ